MDQELLDIIYGKLSLSKSASVVDDPLDGIGPAPVEQMIIINDGDIHYYITLASKTSLETISRSVLYRELLHKDGKDISNAVFIIATRIIPQALRNIASKVSIEVIDVPSGIKMNSTSTFKGTRGRKVTTEKAWRIITRLLEEGPTSIRSVSLKEDVSYGWTYGVIRSLIDIDVVTQKGSLVEITNVDKLLNGVAWERPFENQLAWEVWTGHDDHLEAAREITSILESKEIEFAFTGYTAGGLLTGHSHRFDSLYLYLEEKDIQFFDEAFKAPVNEGVMVRIYQPDRDFYTHSTEADGIRVVSKSIALLDLAGTGYRGMDLTKALVEIYRRL